MHVVKWRSRYTDAAGEIGPVTRSLGEAIVSRSNELFTDILHWLAEAESKDTFEVPTAPGRVTATPDSRGLYPKS
jgi:hypothetical protein